MKKGNKKPAKHIYINIYKNTLAMKKTILLFLLCFVQVSLLAQENNYLPFVEEGKVWNMYCHYEDYLPFPNYHYRYFIEGDTLIAGQNCKKLYAFNENNDKQTMYKMALFESEGKVYFIPCGSTENYILYDFTIPVGSSAIINDPIKPEWEFEMRNNKDEFTKIDGINRHCLFVNRVDDSEFPSGWWIEGIGSELGPLNTWGFEAAGNNRIFWSCEVNGESIYNKSNLQSAGKDEYYPEDTKWTEIRLDTLQYNSWYSKVNGEWMPNFETIEYYVQGEYTDEDFIYKKVYTNGPEWTDSLTLLIHESLYDNGIDNPINVTIFTNNEVPFPAGIYRFDWSIGQGLYYRDIMESNSTGEYPYLFYYGIIDEIKEGYFGGVKPLKYVDLDGKAPYIQGEPGTTNTKGGRIIQGIGITEWNDGECLFGPPNPYMALSCYNTYYWDKYPKRHYRSMLVHFERNGEVLYDVWPEKGTTTGIKSPFSPSDEETLFDLQGRKLPAKPTQGIYIEEGKKRMVK
jgi:hypothetical protein